MAIQYSVELCNERLNQILAVGGSGVILEMRTGAKPANAAAAATGTLIAQMTLPDPFLDDAASCSVAKLGTWQDLLANAAGTIGHFRLYKSNGTTCFMQGSVTITGGGGNMTVDNPVVEANQIVTVTGFTITSGNQ